MRVLVTGASGFVGYHAARALVARGHEVRVLARRLAKAEPLFRSTRDVEIAVGDMTDAPAVAAALAGRDAVLHAASHGLLRLGSNRSRSGFAGHPGPGNSHEIVSRCVGR